MKKTVLTLVLLISIVGFGQTKAEKINYILQLTGSIEGFRSYLIDMTINPLKYNANKTDSLKLVSLENKLTEEEISKRLSKGFATYFSDKEIDDIYNFYSTSAGKKMFNSYNDLNELYKENLKDIYDEINPIFNKSLDLQNEEIESNKETPISVNKVDGFYAVIDFDEQKSELRDLKLSSKPSVLINEILEIKKNIDESGRFVIDIILTKEGAENFRVLTKNNINKPIAIVLSKRIISAPRVINEIPNGRIQISGHFSAQEADEIINAIKK